MFTVGLFDCVFIYMKIYIIHVLNYEGTAYVGICFYMYIYTNIHTYSVCIYIYIYISVYTNIIHVNTCIIDICIHTCVCVHVYVCIQDRNTHWMTM